MKDVFDEQQPAATQQGETQADETQVQSTEDAAPPAADTDKHVPLAALEAERSGRRDWKEKALRYEGELKAMREQRQAAQEPREFDPLQHAVSLAQNERLDTSEMLAREKYGDKAVDEAFEKFQQAAVKDPSLFPRVMNQKHPWGFVVKEMQRAALLDEMGDDPAAWKARLVAEAGTTQTPAAPRVPLPTSLAGARSTAARTTPGFTGPPDLKDIFG